MHQTHTHTSHEYPMVEKKRKKDFLFLHFPGNDHILLFSSEIHLQYNILVDF